AWSARFPAVSSLATALLHAAQDAAVALFEGVDLREGRGRLEGVGVAGEDAAGQCLGEGDGLGAEAAADEAGEGLLRIASAADEGLGEQAQLAAPVEDRGAEQCARAGGQDVELAVAGDRAGARGGAGGDDPVLDAEGTAE